MNQKNRYLERIVQPLLTHERHALFAVVLLMLIPFTAWLSMTLLSLITLRKGWRQGCMLLMPALTAHILVSLSMVSWKVALFDGVIRIVPCFLGACVLRSSSQWKFVFGLYFGLFLLFAIGLNIWIPHWTDLQIVYLKSVLQTVDQGQNLMTFWQDKGLQPEVIAHFFFGFQGVCLFIAIFLPLIFARMIQARLFYPGGFRHEALHFRGDKYIALLLFVLTIGAYYGQNIAINGLVFVVFYMVLAGLSLLAFTCMKMKRTKQFLILGLPILILPLVVIPLYVFFGLLDSFMNCRLYVSSKANH